MRTDKEIEAELDVLDDQDSNDLEIERLRDIVRELMADRQIPPKGVYCVFLDADIVERDEPVVWTFAYEGDADEIQKQLIDYYGEGMSWRSYEPVAYSLEDPDLVGYLKDRMPSDDEGQDERSYLYRAIE